MKFLSFIARYSRITVVTAIGGGVVSGVCKALMIALVNTVLNPHDSSRDWSLFWGFVALCLAMPLTRFVSQAQLTHLGQKAIFDLRMRLSGQILATPLRRLEEMGGPRVMAVLTDDIAVISGTLMSIPVLFMQFAVVLGSLVYMAWLSWRAFLLVLVFILIGTTIYQAAVGRALRFIRDAREQQDVLMKHFRTMLEGAKELKLHGPRRRSFVAEQFRPTANAYRRSSLVGNLIYAATGSFGYQLIFFILLALLIFVMPKLTVVDAKTLTGFTLALFYMLIPLGDILTLWPSIARANIAMDKVNALGLSLTADAHEEVDAPPALPPLAGVELRGVRHAYRHESEGEFTLGPIDLSFRPGELVFLIGGNGSGKTTLAKIICGLYAPEAGEILLNGQPVTDATREAYRQNFSVIFSDFHLFENLLGIDAQGLDARAEAYVEQLRLSNKVRVKGGAFSTIELSQGQRKRLALLTAFLEDRPFYIFDEWAADQDPIFREVFYLQLLPELKARGKSVLVISHDDRYYSLGDRLVKLDYGRLESDSAAQHARPEAREASIPL